MNTWTKILRHVIVRGKRPISHKWTAVVLRYSREARSRDPKVTARRRNFRRSARAIVSSSSRGTSDFSKSNTQVIPASRNAHSPSVSRIGGDGPPPPVGTPHTPARPPPPPRGQRAPRDPAGCARGGSVTSPHAGSLP